MSDGETHDTFRGERLSWSRTGNVLEITLHHSPCNEIGRKTLKELEYLASFLEEGGHGLAAAVFHSDRPLGFSAGADLKELQAEMSAARNRGAPDSEVREQIADFIHRIHRAFNAIDLAPVTTIAATHGVVFGGGFELALTCDLIVADKTTRFCFPELRLGLIPGFGGLPRLARDVANGVVRDFLLSGRSMRATRAHELGLVSQVVARGEAKAVAMSVAEQCAKFDGRAARAGKRFVKSLPFEALEREKALFLDLIMSDATTRALDHFAKTESGNAFSYLP